MSTIFLLHGQRRGPKNFQILKYIRQLVIPVDLHHRPHSRTTPTSCWEGGTVRRVERDRLGEIDIGSWTAVWSWRVSEIWLVTTLPGTLCAVRSFNNTDLIFHNLIHISDVESQAVTACKCRAAPLITQCCSAEIGELILRTILLFVFLLQGNLRFRKKISIVFYIIVNSRSEIFFI